jgi:predicted nucleic acid-binding protein
VTFVLDASIVGSWCFHDEHDARADAAYDRLFDDRARAPILWWFEVRNVVLLGERRKRITEQYALEFLDRVEDLAVDLAPWPDQVVVLALARRHRLTFYDAVYLDLALRERLPLATLDGALAAAAHAEGVPLVEPLR